MATGDLLIKKIKAFTWKLLALCGLLLVLAITNKNVPSFKEISEEARELQKLEVDSILDEIVLQSVISHPNFVESRDSLRRYRSRKGRHSKLDCVIYKPSLYLDSLYTIRELVGFTRTIINTTSIFPIRPIDLDFIEDTLKRIGCNEILIDSIRLSPIVVGTSHRIECGDSTGLVFVQNYNDEKYPPLKVNVKIFLDTTLFNCVDVLVLDNYSLYAVSNPILYSTLRLGFAGTGLEGRVEKGSEKEYVLSGNLPNKNIRKYRGELNLKVSDILDEDISMYNIPKLMEYLDKEIQKSRDDVVLFDLNIPGKLIFLVVALVILGMNVFLTFYMNELYYVASVSDVSTFTEDWLPLFRYSELGVLYYMILSIIIPSITTLVLAWRAIVEADYLLFLLSLSIIASEVIFSKRYLATVKVLRREG